MLKKTKTPTNREAVLLACLINGEKYGRELRNEYEARTGQAMPLGSLYTTLDRMVGKGFLTSYVGESTPGRRGNRRTYYRVLAPGIRALDQLEAWWAGALGASLNAQH